MAPAVARRCRERQERQAAGFHQRRPCDHLPRSRQALPHGGDQLPVRAQEAADQAPGAGVDPGNHPPRQPRGHFSGRVHGRLGASQAHRRVHVLPPQPEPQEADRRQVLVPAQGHDAAQADQEVSGCLGNQVAAASDDACGRPDRLQGRQRVSLQVPSGAGADRGGVCALVFAARPRHEHLRPGECRGSRDRSCQLLHAAVNDHEPRRAQDPDGSVLVLHCRHHRDQSGAGVRCPCHRTKERVRRLQRAESPGQLELPRAPSLRPWRWQPPLLSLQLPVCAVPAKRDGACTDVEPHMYIHITLSGREVMRTNLN
eukprot:m.38143 g.38143  ORF g.38143 m.38143 type:complete len:314 (+) comp5488_c0_seq1:619-1560(+)